jgi:hypothetical protein
VYLFFNTTVPYSLSSTGSGFLLSGNQSLTLTGNIDLIQPSILAFENLLCTQSLTVSISSVYNQSINVISHLIPDPLLPDFQVPNVDLPEVDSSTEGSSVFFGIGLSIAIAITAGFYFRSLYRERRPRMRPWKKPETLTQQPVSNEEPPEMVQSETEVEMEVQMSEIEQIMVVIPDPYEINSQGFTEVEKIEEGLPDSPYW